MAFDWKALVGNVAPTVATALLGPLGGAALSAIGSILGLDDATEVQIQQAIEGGRLTPEHIAELRKLELQYLDNEKERGFKYAELVFKDLDSARNREIQTKDSTNKILAFIIVGAFIAMVGATMMGWTKAESVMAGTLIGYLSAKAEQVLSYYFGSNKDSARKTEIIAQSDAIK